MSYICNKRIILYSIVLGFWAMALMLYYNFKKEIEQKIETQESVEEQVDSVGIDGVYDDIYQNKNVHKPLTISLPSAEVAERVVFSEKYTKHCVQLSFEGLPKDYFMNTPLTGSVDGVKDIVCQYKDGKTILSIYMTGILACTQKRKDRDIILDFKPLREVYDKIVVIDPGHGGEDNGLKVGDMYEKEITLSIVMELKKMLDETDIKAFYTRLDDETVTNQTRTILANELNADLFLSVQCGFDENNEPYQGITTYYNDTFFIPTFGNADFAYIVEEHVVRAVSGSALGIKAGEKENELLKHSMVPTAYVEIGNLSNETEYEFLKQEEYVNKLAYGLYSSIVGSYKQMIE